MVGYGGGISGKKKFQIGWDEPLHEQQRQLEIRYAGLRDSRDGAVFFVEHGLDDDEVEDLTGRVRDALREHSLESGWWDMHSLPLIVAATEIGYRYRGSGTNFWPVLEEDLGVGLTGASRERVRDLFVSASERYRGAQPPGTPWAKAFHLIAWPITHALLPHEFHRPLATALANLRGSVAGFDDRSLYRAVRAAAAEGSSRFETFLDNSELVVSVARSLLGEGTSDLSPTAMERIAIDLRADNVARRSLDLARRMQRVARRREPPQPTPSKPLRLMRGTLQIRVRDGGLALEASFPALDSEFAQSMRRALRQRRYTPRLWGVTNPIPSDQILSGLPFTLKLGSIPAEDAPVFQDLAELNVDDEVLRTLAAFELTLSVPAVFRVNAEGDTAQLVRGTEISGFREYLVLTDELWRSEGPFTALGTVGPYNCYRVVPRSHESVQLLEGLGYRVRFGISITVAGDPPLANSSDEGPSFYVGDSILIVPKQSYPDGLRIGLGEDVVSTDSQIVHLSVPEGRFSLRLSSGDETREISFKGVRTELPVYVPLCHIDLHSSETTIQALLNGSFTFVVDGRAPLAGLRLVMELEAAGTHHVVAGSIGALPQVVTLDAEPWATLLEDVTRDLLQSVNEARLTVRVGHLATRSWVLERKVRPCWWEFDENGNASLKNETGNLRFGEVLADAPFLPPRAMSGTLGSEARLLVPVGLQGIEYGSAELSTTLCLSPAQTTLTVYQGSKPDLQRRRRGKGNGIGLQDLVEAYLRWSLAESEHLIAEFKRRQISTELDKWLAELCCGREWARRELDRTVINPWGRLVEVCQETRLGLDSYVELSSGDEHRVLEIAVAKIQEGLPDLWVYMDTEYKLSAEDYEMLDDACISAYEELSRSYEQLGEKQLGSRIGEGDPSADSSPGAWAAVLKQVNQEMELSGLAEMLLPTNRASELVGIDIAMMSLDDLTRELALWLRGARKALVGSPPSEDLVKGSLALWIEPEVAVDLDWRGAIDTLMVDRLVARAVRYVALRARRVKRGA